MGVMLSYHIKYYNCGLRAMLLRTSVMPVRVWTERQHTTPPEHRRKLFLLPQDTQYLVLIWKRSFDCESDFVYFRACEVGTLRGKQTGSPLLKHLCRAEIGHQGCNRVI